MIAIRDESAGDEDGIAEVIALAFAGNPHSDGSEAAIVARLRTEGDLTLSLLAEDGDEIIGHAAFSPVAIDGRREGWFGLGPVAVMPGRQTAGIGAALIVHGMERLRADGADGCVVLGDPEYYRRFGFAHDPQLSYPGTPPRYFQRCVFRGAAPRGTTAYAPAFAV